METQATPVVDNRTQKDTNVDNEEITHDVQTPEQRELNDGNISDSSKLINMQSNQMA